MIICCDDKKILNVAKKFKAKAVLTSKHHTNGTERITEAFLKTKKNYDLVLDIQGDEPLISPNHIDKVIDFHKKNNEIDVILPHLKVPFLNNTNIVKVLFNKKNEVLYISRANVPFQFKKQTKFINDLYLKPNRFWYGKKQLYIDSYFTLRKHDLDDSSNCWYLFH